MAWIRVSERLPENNGKYKVLVDTNPIHFIESMEELEVYFSDFNGNKLFHVGKGMQVHEWLEAEN